MSSESDDEEAASSTNRKLQSQASKSKGPASAFALGEEDRQKIVRDLTFYILAKEKNRVPFKKADLMKACNLNGKSRELQEDVLDKVKGKLNHVFGFAMMDMEEKKGSYVLINRLEEELEPSMQHLRFSDEENGQMGLLYTVLGLIFMSGDVIRDDVLWKFLTQMGVYEDEVGGKKAGSGGGGGASQRAGAALGGGVAEDVRKLFPDVKSLIFKEWGQRQNYLNIKPIDTGDTDSVSNEIRWGERARLEVKQSSVFKIICQMYECKPKDFKEQYEKVVNSEGAKVFEEEEAQGAA